MPLSQELNFYSCCSAVNKQEEGSISGYWSLLFLKVKNVNDHVTPAVNNKPDFLVKDQIHWF